MRDDRRYLGDRGSAEPTRGPGTGRSYVIAQERDVSGTTSRYVTLLPVSPSAGPGWVELHSPDCVVAWRITYRVDLVERTEYRRTTPTAPAGCYLPEGGEVAYLVEAVQGEHTDPATGLLTGGAAEPEVRALFLPRVREAQAATPVRPGYRVSYSAAATAGTVSLVWRVGPPGIYAVGAGAVRFRDGNSSAADMAFYAANTAEPLREVWSVGGASPGAMQRWGTFHAGGAGGEVIVTTETGYLRMDWVLTGFSAGSPDTLEFYNSGRLIEAAGNYSTPSSEAP